MKSYLKNISACFIISVISLSSAQKIRASEDKPFFIKFKNSTRRYRIENQTVINLFGELVNKQQHGNNEYTIEKYSVTTINFLLQLAQEYARHQSFSTTNTGAVFANLSTADIETAIAAAVNLSAPLLEQFLRQHLQQLRNPVGSASTATSSSLMPPVPAKKTKVLSKIGVVINNVNFTITPEESVYLPMLQDMAENLETAEPINISFINDDQAFGALLNILQQCVIANNKNKADTFDEIMSSHTLSTRCSILQIASYFGVSQLLPMFHKWFADFILKETTTTEELSLILQNLTNDILDTIKQLILEPINLQIKQNIIYSSEPKKITDIPANRTWLFSMDGTKGCFQEDQKNIVVVNLINKAAIKLPMEKHNLRGLVAISDDGSRIAAMSDDKIFIWNSLIDKLIELQIDIANVENFSIKMSRDNQKIIYTSSLGEIIILYGDEFKKIKSINPRALIGINELLGVLSVTWSHDSRYCLIASYAIQKNITFITLYDTQNGKVSHLQYSESGKVAINNFGASNFLALDTQNTISTITKTGDRQPIMITKLFESLAPPPERIACSHTKKFILVISKHFNSIIDADTGDLIKLFNTQFSKFSFMPDDEGLWVWQNHDRALMEYSFARNDEIKKLVTCLEALTIPQLRKIIIFMLQIKKGKLSDPIELKSIAEFATREQQEIALLNNFLSIVQAIYELNKPSNPEPKESAKAPSYQE